jgi:putative membrane protein
MIDTDKLRTMLANERTMLAYIRTALSAWIFGLAAVKLFSDNFLIVCLGWIVAVSGVIILFWGIYESRRRHLHIYS